MTSSRQGMWRKLPRPSAWFLFGLTALALMVIVTAGRRTDIAAATDGLSVGPLLAVVTLFGAANMVQAENWFRLSRAGTAAVSRGAGWRVYAVSQPLRYLVPGGHIAARGALARREGLTVRAGLGLGVLDLGLSVCTLGLLSLLTAPAWLGLPTTSAATAWLLALAAIPALVAATILIAPQLVGRTVHHLFRRILGEPPRLPATDVVRGQLVRYLGSVVVRAAGFVVLVWSLTAAAGGERMLGSGHILGVAVGAFAVGNLSGRLAPIAPAGLGVRDVTVAAVLTAPLGLALAAYVALVARALDVVAEAALLSGVLLTTANRSTTLRPGSTVTLDDGTDVAVVSVELRTWSNVAVGRRGTATVFCKQALDRRGRPDRAAAAGQAQAYRDAARCGLQIPALIGTAERAGIEVREWRRLHAAEDPAAVAIHVLDRVTASATDGAVPVIAIRDVLVEEDGNAQAAGQDRLVVVDPGPAALTHSGCRAHLIASLLLANWGRPLRAFARGPEWGPAARVWAATRPLARRGDAEAVAELRQVCERIIATRRREWVGVTSLQALLRLVGVHTLGRLYGRRIERGIAGGRLDPVVDVTPAERALETRSDGRTDGRTDDRTDDGTDIQTDDQTDTATRGRYQRPAAAGRYDREAHGPVARAITAGERRAARRALHHLNGLSGHRQVAARTWLDVAGGTGRMATARLLPPAGRIGADLSAAMLARDCTGSPRVVADACALPFAVASVDLAVIVRLVHRTSDRLFAVALAEALRVSRDGVVVSYARPTPPWRAVVRHLLFRTTATGGRSAEDVMALVASVGGVVRADVAVLPLLSGGRVLAVSRPGPTGCHDRGQPHRTESQPRDR